MLIRTLRHPLILVRSLPLAAPAAAMMTTAMMLAMLPLLQLVLHQVAHNGAAKCAQDAVTGILT